MIKTAVENSQNLIVEGCYIPFDWQKDFDASSLAHIRYYCLVMSEKYIRTHYADIQKYANVIENRLCDDLTLEQAIADNASMLDGARANGLNVLLIDDKYDIEI